MYLGLSRDPQRDFRPLRFAGFGGRPAFRPFTNPTVPQGALGGHFALRFFSFPSSLLRHL